MNRILAAVAILTLSGCQTINIGESRTTYGISRDRYLHALSLPFGRKLLLIRDDGISWCWVAPNKPTKCKPEYKGDALKTRDTTYDPK